MHEKNDIIEYLKQNLKESRFEHTLRVAKLAVEMAQKECLEGDRCEEPNANLLEESGYMPRGKAFEIKAELAALLHDVARNISAEELSDHVDSLALDERYRSNINLAHSKIGAELVQTKFGIRDEDVINAISYHTTGRAGMSKLEKIIFLADAIEPARNYKNVEHIREQAKLSIDAGCLSALEGTIEFINRQGIYLDPDTERAYEYFKEKVHKESLASKAFRANCSYING